MFLCFLYRNLTILESIQKVVKELKNNASYIANDVDTTKHSLHKLLSVANLFAIHDTIGQDAHDNERPWRIYQKELNASFDLLVDKVSRIRYL